MIEMVGFFKYHCDQCNQYFRLPEHTCGSVGLVQKVESGIKAIAEWVQSGCEISEEKLYNNRLSICMSCENYSNGTCRLCGCNLAIKMRMRRESCPINKWPNP